MEFSQSQMLIAAIAALWGALGVTLGIIRKLYDERDKLRLTAITDLQERLHRAETRETERAASAERYVQTLETAVEVTKKQGDTLTTILNYLQESQPSVKRQSRSS